MVLTTALANLKSLQAKMHAYNHASGMIYYDAVTSAPDGTDAGRGETLAILSGESYKTFINP